MDRYDPDDAPDPAAWLALDEPARIGLVERAHPGRGDRIHARGYNRRLHASLHAVIESQIAANDPPATAAAVAAAVAKGLRRHAAIHMVADVLVRQVAARTPYDAAEWTAKMEALDPAEWLGGKLRQHAGAAVPVTRKGER